MDHKVALTKLEAAFNNAEDFSCEKLSEKNQNDIEQIVNGHHLTFRYMLFTALLAKVTDSKIHMRSLQAQSSLDGAYDARSLCHKVFVPFEQTKLKGKLGGSNEPYLNKPARFPEISTENAVRKGKDKDMLVSLHDLLNRLEECEEDDHSEALTFALKIAGERSAGLVHDIQLPEVSYTSINAWKILNQFLDKSCGGESAAAVVGAILRFAYAKPCLVTTHPVNQCGASSKEVGDIDVTKGKALVISLEVKDKLFSLNDVNHALRKVKESGNDCLTFMIGRHAFPLPDNFHADDLVEEQGAEGMDLSFAVVDAFAKHWLKIMPAPARREMFSVIAQVLDEMRATDATKKHFVNSLTLN